MTVLQRTDLTTSQKIQCAAAAVAGQHAHGSKTALSETYEISRPTVYAVGAAAESVLRSHFESPLLQGAAVDVRVDDAQLRRAVVALRVLAPNAIRPIEDLVPLLYPGVKVSYGTIQQMLVETEARAARFNAQASLGGVEAGALDEMFSQGEPVLAGVDLDSGYLFGLSLSATRDGEAWAELLREGQCQGLELSVVVKNAAKGIAAGVSEVFPQAEQRDDSQGDQCSRVPDRTAGPRLAHAARLSALADTALIHGRCRALALLDTPRPRALRAPGQAQLVCVKMNHRILIGAR